MDKRTIQFPEIEKIVWIFVIVQLAVLTIALFAPLPTSGQTISSAATSVGIPGWQVALGYGLYLGIGGFIFAYILLKGLKNKEYIIKVMEAVFIIAGTYFIIYLLFPSLGILLYVPGLILWYAKTKYPQITNYCAVIASTGYGLLFALEFGFDIMVAFMIILAIYDYIAVYVTKHMVVMANAFADMQLAFLVYAIRRIDSKTISSVKLGSGDLIFPAAFAGSVAFAIRFLALPGILIWIPMLMILGSTFMLLFLLRKVQKNLKPYPAIPYVAFGSFIGMFVGFALVGLIL